MYLAYFKSMGQRANTRKVDERRLLVCQSKGFMVTKDSRSGGIPFCKCFIYHKIHCVLGFCFVILAVALHMNGVITSTSMKIQRMEVVACKLRYAEMIDWLCI